MSALNDLLVERSPQRQFETDWLRQRTTAADILRRLETQEGVILADQVGMGKTYVALAVAVTQILATDPPGQVLVLAPANVARKWVNEWQQFAASLLMPDHGLRAVPDVLRSGEQIFAALDDPPERRCHLVVATHQALTTQLKDSFVQLALLQYATQRRPNRDVARELIAKWVAEPGGILRDPRLRSAAVVRSMLDSSPKGWRDDWRRLTGTQLPDDPVPAVVEGAVRRVNLDELRAVVDGLPRYRSANIAARLREVRVVLSTATQQTWKAILTTTELSLPLLIFDEAHRLKNDSTQLSGLFAGPDDPRGRGALTGIADRMLFLTATPFELDHRELIRVLNRFGAVRQPPRRLPPLADRLQQLSDALDNAQAHSLRLDKAWDALTPEDAAHFSAWTPSRPPPEGGAHMAAAWRAATAAVQSRQLMAESLHDWVIRHERLRRRSYLPGDEIRAAGTPGRGLDIEDDMVLPFLLAGRAQAVAGEDSHGAGNPLFAYGIASSFEAFRRLGSRHAKDSDLPAEDRPADSDNPGGSDSSAAQWYRGEIDDLLLRGGLDRGQHPKVRATVDRALDLWWHGHKCLVFCWYIDTGEALEQALETELIRQTTARAAERLGLLAEDGLVDAELTRIADRLLTRDRATYGQIHARLRDEFASWVGPHAKNSSELVEQLALVAVRHMRRPAYLVRHARLRNDMTADDLWAAPDSRLWAAWQRFASRAAQMGDDERTRVFDALLGSSGDDEADREIAGRGASLRSVRRAHGGTRRETRERLTVLFNTPFAPDILVASSVMGEGIDLHHECRHVIHHDLDWNPSVLEQRTGRLDRIGALAETEGNIQIFEPYLTGTHDEKMYRVVKDRAGWFDIVMGRKSATDERATDHEEGRLPLAPAIADALRIDLTSRAV